MTRSGKWSRRFGLTVVVCVLASSADAQTIVGRVVDAADRDAIAGVVVSVLDSTGRVLTRTVTVRAADFRLSAGTAASRLHFRRIGYSPVEVAVSAAVGGRIDAVMRRVPTQLPRVTTLASSQCDARPDGGAAIALWEEARSGLLASITAREAKVGSISVLSYTSWFEADTALPRIVSRVLMDSASKMFYLGRTPATVEAVGYFTATKGGGSYSAPDDVTLFDETFLSTHCFSLAAADDSTIGLRFEPTKDRERLVEVTGAVWMRKAPLELLSVDYSFVNVDPRIARARPGGAIIFGRMPTGIATITEWRLRSATIYESGVKVNETGAILETMQWPDAPTFSASLATVSGTARRPGGAVVAGASIGLVGTPFTARSDGAGRFSLTGVPAGVYALTLGDPDLVHHGIMTPSHRIEVGPGNNAVTIEGEAPSSLVARACRDYGAGIYSLWRKGSQAIFARVVTDRSIRVANRSFHFELRPEGLPATSAPLVINGKTNAEGSFRLCGLLPGKAVITVDIDRRTKGRAEVTLGRDVAYELVTVALKTRDRP